MYSWAISEIAGELDSDSWLPNFFAVGLVGFEPTASWSRTRRSTKLSHSPNFTVVDKLSADYFAHLSANGKQP